MKIRNSKFEIRNSVGGQALLEVLVALAIGIIIASAFVSLGAISLRNSTFSNNRARATQLAQEGIEALISMRDQNTPGAISNFGPTDRWSMLYSLPNPVSACAQPENVSSDCSDFTLATCTLVGVQQWCITRSVAAIGELSWRISGSQFSRKIRITNTADSSEETTLKNVTVFVWWEDASGRHESVLSRKLYIDPLP